MMRYFFNILRSAIILILCLFFSGRAWSQSTNYIHTDLGISVMALRDEGMSPLMYSGAGFAGALSLERHSASKTIFHSLSFGSGDKHNQYNRPISFWEVSYRSITLYHKGNDSQNSILWGWSNNNSLNYYTNPAHRNFGERSNYFTTFGPAAFYSRTFDVFGKELLLQVPANVQLLGFYLRPDYVTNAPAGYTNPEYSGFRAFIESAGMFLPHQAWNFGVSPKLIYRLKSGNALSAGYEYEFTRINDPEPLTQSMGVWHVGLITKL